MHVVSVALGGAIGAVCRYKLSEWVLRRAMVGFPLGTLMVNLVGCFFMGVLYASIGQADISQNIKLFLFAGLLGAFTTFSTYSIEIVSLFNAGQWRAALLSFVLHNLLGITLGFAGYWVMKQVV